jgi:hypothetical protein
VPSLKGLDCLKVRGKLLRGRIQKSQLLERFHNRCIRVVRVERRFSAAFAADKRPAQAAEVDDLSGLSDFLFLPYTRA